MSANSAEIGTVQALDCIKGMARLAEGSVDLVFADPPFNIGYEYDEYDDKREANDYLEWSRQWITAAKRVLKPNGTFWLAIGDEFAAELKVLCTRELGFHCRSWVIWFYTFGVHCKYKFTRSHAHLFHFVLNPKDFTFNSLDVRVPSARQIVYGDKRADVDGRVPDDTWMMAPVLPAEVPTRDGFILRPQDIPERFPQNSDTWYFSRVAGTFKERAGFHGCQMPEQLLGRIIRACSNEGELILDPFAGSGTTLAVAKKLKRRFTGFEISKKYATMIAKRLYPIQPGDALVGPEDAVRSAPRTAGVHRSQRAPVASWARTSDSAVLTRANVSLGQVAVANGELATAIAEAFMASHQGYSSDRVLADPALNESFLNNCRKLGVPGDAREWNHLLLNARKKRGLAVIETLRRTAIPRLQMEPYIFASEIAWRRLSERRNLSLDEILCDPELAAEFDSLAKGIAPGFGSFHYRWAALSVRKFAAKGNALLNKVTAVLGPRTVSLADANQLSNGRGHYLIKAGDVPFYVGFAECYRQCPFLHPDRVGAALSCLEQSARNENELTVRTLGFDVAKMKKEHTETEETKWISARRARLIIDHEPIANVPHAA